MCVARAHGLPVRRLVSEHRWFVAVLLLGLLLRVATSIAYRPMLVGLTDVWAYLGESWQFNIPFHFIGAPDRPFGYPLALWLLARPFGFHAGIVTTLQHLAGLATGTLAYVALVRLGVRRWIAVLAAAFVLFDTHLVALEENLLPETFFTFLLMTAAVLIALARSSLTALALSGVLLGLAATLRFAAFTAAIGWGVYLLWQYWRRPLAIGVAVLGLAIPLGAYGGAHASATGRFGFSDASGRFLYARVAGIADCSKMKVPAGTRSLCQPASQRLNNPVFYLWDSRSPMRHLFPGWGATAAEQHAQDQLLHRFAVAAIRARPFAYLGVAAGDFLHDLTPGYHGLSEENSLELPPRLEPDAGPLAAARWPGFRNEARWPAPLLHGLSKVLATPVWFLAFATVLGVVEFGVWLTRLIRRRPLGLSRWPVTFLFLSMPLATLVGASAVAQYGLRFVVAVAPLIVVGGGLAVEDALEELSASRKTGLRWLRALGASRALRVKAR